MISANLELSIENYEMNAKLSRDSASEALLSVAGLLVDYGNKLSQTAGEVLSDQVSHKRASNILNNSINDLENCSRNFNLNVLARIQAELAAADKAIWVIKKVSEQSYLTRISREVQ